LLLPGDQAMKYLDDFTVGDTFDFTTVPASAEQIIAFAKQYDPQQFHLDEEFARTGPHGGLIASGFQTLLIVFGPIMRDLMNDVANIAGIGFDKLRWLRPYRPDQVLHVRITITAVTHSRSKPDRGILAYTLEARDSDDNLVMTVDVPVMVQRRQDAVA